jgi:hypothetical protein
VAAVAAITTAQQAFPAALLIQSPLAAAALGIKVLEAMASMVVTLPLAA